MHVAFHASNFTKCRTGSSLHSPGRELFAFTGPGALCIHRAGSSWHSTDRELFAFTTGPGALGIHRAGSSWHSPGRELFAFTGPRVFACEYRARALQVHGACHTAWC